MSSYISKQTFELEDWPSLRNKKKRNWKNKIRDNVPSEYQEEDIETLRMHLNRNHGYYQIVSKNDKEAEDQLINKIRRH